MSITETPLLVIEDLRVAFPGRDGGMIEAVRGVSFTLGRERLGIVGESGSGKSQTGRAILGLTAPEGRISARRLEFSGVRLKLGNHDLRPNKIGLQLFRLCLRHGGLVARNGGQNHR